MTSIQNRIIGVKYLDTSSFGEVMEKIANEKLLGLGDIKQSFIGYSILHGWFSYRRREWFDQFQRNDNSNELSWYNSNKTRWLSLRGSLDRLLRIWNSLKKYIEASKKAIQRIQSMIIFNSFFKIAHIKWKSCFFLESSIRLIRKIFCFNFNFLRYRSSKSK